MRRTAVFLVAPFQGFQRVDQNIDPAVYNSVERWGYQENQVMSSPNPVNRVMSAPYKAKNGNVNRYRKGVWIDIDMHPAMRVALEPYLKKLQLTRTIPNTDPKEAAEDFHKIAPLVGDDYAKLNWLAKVFQLCGHKKAGDVAIELWNKECAARFMKGEVPAASSSSALTTVPPIGLIEGILYAAANSDKGDYKAIFEKCLKDGWNLTPKFSNRMWSYLLQTAGHQKDGKAVRMILAEMLDVQANLETIDRYAYVRALNAITDKDDYNWVKKFLFNISADSILNILTVYKSCRGTLAETMAPELEDNEKMFYHVGWHNSIRQPQRFSPRQLYFNYKPNFTANLAETKGISGSDVIKQKIAKWKEEGLLPEDYEFEGDFVDSSARFKQTMRHEHWSKLPKILKNPKYGYCGEH